MAQLVKTALGLAIASVKSALGLAIASVKTMEGLDNTSAGSNVVTFDATAKGSQAGGGLQTTCTVAITVGTLTEGCLVVHAALGAASTTTFTGVTYNGVSMTQIGTTQTVGGSGSGKTSAWRLVNPAAGTNNIVATVNVPLSSATEVIMVEGSSWSLVNQTTPVSGAAQGNGASTAPSVTVVSGTGNRVIAGANGGDSFNAWAATDRNHQNVNTGTGGGNSAFSDRAGSASEAMTWGMASSDSWAAIGFSLDHS